jgi:hypothetical protein
MRTILTQLPVSWGWRVAFGLGVVLGLVILLVRRHVRRAERKSLEDLARPLSAVEEEAPAPV